MKLPYSWLNDYTSVEASPRDYSHRMTMTGSKVESWSSPADGISGVVCGKILEVKKHEDSDHLMICMLDVGDGAPLQIVSGAPNLQVGDIVPVATDGAILPGGEIKATVMRGVQSSGMLCSFQELGLTENDCPYADTKGILVFPPQMGAKPGDNALGHLGLDETIIEFEITPNRPDCLSIIGLARETSASYNTALSLPTPQVKGGAGKISDHLAVKISAPALCPRYSAGMVDNVRLAPSPQWMRDRLRNAGIRPINNIVDITNYVMLEYGQPMHAFDYGCIDDREIIVRTSVPQEKVVTLDGQTRQVAENTLLISDPQKAIGIAGVMGGENSEITAETRRVVFESACFSGPAVRVASRRIGMRTEASGRFEKGLDAENTIPALMRALELVERLDAGDVLSGIIDVYPAPKQPRKIPLDDAFINRLLGTSFSQPEMEKILISLGFAIEGGCAVVPSWRDDVEGIADLAEEVGRIYGFDKIESTRFAAKAVKGGLSPRQAFEKALANACHQGGFYESRSVSFMGPRDFDRLCFDAKDPKRMAVKILNPLGEDQSLMRTTLLPAMLDAAARNDSYRQPQLRLYEAAMVYTPALAGGAPDATALPTETKMLAMIMYGQDDFFDLKGSVENILAAADIPGTAFRPCQDNPSYHPGRTADIFCGDTWLGRVGQVHPVVLKNWGIDRQVYAAELNIDSMFACRQGAKTYNPLPRFPAVTRDLAVVCDKNIYVAQLESCIKGSAGPLLVDLDIFDVYTGGQVPQGKKSVAFALAFRSPDHTMSDAETDSLISAILSALQRECGALLRS